MSSIETVGGQIGRVDRGRQRRRPRRQIRDAGRVRRFAAHSRPAVRGRELTLVGSYCYGHDARVGDFAQATTMVAKYRGSAAGPRDTPFQTRRGRARVCDRRRQKNRIDQGPDRTLSRRSRLDHVSPRRGIEDGMSRRAQRTPRRDPVAGALREPDKPVLAPIARVSRARFIQSSALGGNASAIQYFKCLLSPRR